MKLTIAFEKLEELGFAVKRSAIAGVECCLVVPKLAINPDIWNKDTLIYRSSIWTKDGDLISPSYKKFFNLTEATGVVRDPIDGDFKDMKIISKTDGCCDAGTLIYTDSGTMTIREICENKYQGLALGLNHESGKEEFSPILAHSIKNNNNDWYELVLENGSILKLTGSHRVWLPELECYRRVDELLGNEKFLFKKD